MQQAIWRLGAVVLAVACVPGCGQSESDRAGVLMGQGEYTAAIAIWREALAEQPDDHTLVTRIATAQARMGRLDEAEATLRQAIARSPDLPVLHHNLGLVHLKDKQFDAALAELHEVVRLQESYPNAHYYIGLIHEMRGDEATARRYYVHEVNKGASAGAWNRIFELNKKDPRPTPNTRPLAIFSGLLLAVAVVAYGLRVYLDARQGRELSLHGAE
jgi:tetratricopeptide (TPR) repeat protein